VKLKVQSFSGSETERQEKAPAPLLLLDVATAVIDPLNYCRM